jgi:peptidoglycan-associated lipoprotein
LLFLKKPIEIISIQLSFILGRGFFMKKFMALAALLLTAACGGTYGYDESNIATGGKNMIETARPSTGMTDTTVTDRGTDLGASEGLGDTAPVAAAPAAGGDISQEEFHARFGSKVYFDYDSHALRDDARASLQKQASWLKQYPSINVTVEGHCDERGTREYNLALGERRANAMRNYLGSLGVNTSRIEPVTYGKERPEALGSNEQSWALNRRGITLIK